MKNHLQLCTFFTYQCGCGQQPRHYYRDGLFSHQNAIVYAGHPSSISCIFLLLGVLINVIKDVMLTLNINNDNDDDDDDDDANFQRVDCLSVVALELNSTVFP
uniref:Uncharacterized protein n=1 Tax=Glossina austeni TaxID=7395 RepID=A0A1A9ULR1_GLOAU